MSSGCFSCVRSRVLLLATTLLSSACAGEPNVSFGDIPDDLPAPVVPTAHAGSGSTWQSGGAAGSAMSAGAGGGAGSPNGGAEAGGSAPVVAGSGGESPGMGGAAGSGGQAPVVHPTTILDVIDDIEGAFPVLPQRAGRNGGWFTVHDGSNGQALEPGAVPLDPPHAESRFAARIGGVGFTDWGFQLGVALTAPAVGYDASRYCGVRFLAKGTSGGWSMLVSDRASIPAGGVCVPGSADPETRCYHYVGKVFTPGADWQEYKFRFDELRYLDVTDSPRRLDPSAVYDILFNVFNGTGAAFELLVDDLSFMAEASSDCQ